LEEIASLVEGPFNRPTFTNPRSKELFREEYELADRILRAKLTMLGEIDAIGKKEFSMGDPWNSSRKIGVTVNVEYLFSEELVKVLRDAVEQMPTDYLIILSGEREPGAGTFYICVSRNRDVLGYASDQKLLKRFGF
jgi:hypothetical protein